MGIPYHNLEDHGPVSRNCSNALRIFKPLFLFSQMTLMLQQYPIECKIMFQEFRLLAVNHLFKQETDASTCFSSFKPCINNATYGLVKKLLFKIIKIFVQVSSGVWNLSICVNFFNLSTNRWYILEHTCSSQPQVCLSMYWKKNLWSFFMYGVQLS